MLDIRPTALGLLLAIFVAPSMATATTTLTRYDFDATFGGDAPIKELTGYYVIKGDTDTGFGDLVDVNVQVGTTHFTLANSGGGQFNYASQFTRAGGLVGDGDEYYRVATDTYDFSVVIYDRPVGGPPDTDGSNINYTAENWAGVGSANERDGSFRYTVTNETAGAVPEPSSWALMITGFGLAGSVMRRRIDQTTTSLQLTA